MENISSEDREWRWRKQTSIGLSLGAWPCAHPLMTQRRFLPNSIPGSHLKTVVTWGLTGRCLAEALCSDQLLLHWRPSDLPLLCHLPALSFWVSENVPLWNFPDYPWRASTYKRYYIFSSLQKLSCPLGKGDSEVKKEMSTSQRYVISTFLPGMLYFYK